MKSICAWTLVAAMMGTSVPLSAQAPVDTAVPATPILTRAAIRRAVEDVFPGQGSTAADWSRVQGIRLGLEIFVTTDVLLASPRYFGRADDTSLTLLRATDPALSAAQQHVLRKLIVKYPAEFAAPRTSVEYENQDERFRLTAEGVFVNGQLVATREQFSERIDRQAVREITGPITREGSALTTALAALGGLVAGFFGFLAIAFDESSSWSGGRETGAYGLLIGTPIATGWLGYHLSLHETQKVLYRR